MNGILQARNRLILCHKYWLNICSAIFQPIKFFIVAYVTFNELAGQPYFSSRLGKDFSVRQASFVAWGPTSLLSSGWLGLLRRSKATGGAKLIAYPRLLPRLRMCLHAVVLK